MDHDDLDGFEDLTPEDDWIGPAPVERTGPLPLERTRRSATRLGLSVPGAIGGVLLVGAIAFGANLSLVGASRDADVDTSTPAADVAKADGDKGLDKPDKPDVPEPTKAPQDEPKDDPTKAPESEPTDKAEPTDAAKDGEDGEDGEDAEPTKKPEPDPTKKPTPKPTEKPDAEPTKKPVLDLALAVKEGAILVKWSSCEVDGADYYKVVRSTDSTVAWPAGDGDTLVGAVEMGGTLKAWDGDAPDGKKVWYRVFCVRHTEGGYKVLSASGAKSVVAPASTPKPTPKPTPEVTAMWIEAGVEGGNVVVHWEACGSDAFSHYRIVRKVDGEGGVIAEIDDAGATTYVDDAVDPGHTYHYIVQAKGTIDGDWFLLSTTEWVSVAVE